jgi:ribosome-associated heat shock protein Hsp15
METRLDVWLWRARFFRTRSLASAYVSGRGVRLTRGGATRKVSKPGHRVLPGDVVSFPLRSQIVALRVLSCGERRGPAGEARTLYDNLSECDQEQSDA